PRSSSSRTIRWSPTPRTAGSPSARAGPSRRAERTPPPSSPPRPRRGGDDGLRERRRARHSCEYRALLWWRGQDLNLRPLGYEPNELPNCSTPRRCAFSLAVPGRNAKSFPTAEPAGGPRPSRWRGPGTGIPPPASPGTPRSALRKAAGEPPLLPRPGRRVHPAGGRGAAEARASGPAEGAVPGTAGERAEAGRASEYPASALVAGAGFDPATSGLGAHRAAVLLHLPSMCFQPSGPRPQRQIV